MGRVIHCTQQCCENLDQKRAHAQGKSRCPFPVQCQHVAETHPQRESLRFACSFFQDLKWKQHEFVKAWPAEEAAVGNSGEPHVKV